MTRRKRWVRFSAVGIAGFVLQLVTLWLLVHRMGLQAPLAIAAAVLVTVSHNFFWHGRVTWPDRPRAGRLRRWLSFHLSTGAVSVAANVGVTTAVTAVTGLPLVAANAVAVVAASLANFLVSDRLVFRS